MAQTGADDPQLTPQELLEARVDAMMQPAAQLQPKTPALSADAKPVPEPKPDAAVPTAPLLRRTVTKETVVPQLVRAKPLAEPIPELAAQQAPLPDNEAPIQPLTIDTAQSDAAIDDIVAQEADEVLRAEDAGIAEAVAAAEGAEPDELRPAGHPIFWFFILLLVIVIIIAAVVLVNPNLELPFGA